jgi:hypothetical protein
VAEQTAVYRAVADFSSLVRQARLARRELEKLDRQSGISLKEYEQGQRRVAQATDEDAEAHRSFDQALSSVVQRITRWRREVRQGSGDMVDLSARVREVRDAHIDLSDSIEVTTQRQQEFVRSTRDVHREGTLLERFLGRLSTAFGGVGGGGNELTRTLGGVSGSFREARIAGDNFGAMLGTLRFPAIIAGLHTLVGLISSLAAGLVALIPRLAQASTVVAGLPGLLLGIGQGAATAIVGFQGLGNAIKALIDQQQNASQEQQQQAQLAEQVTSAQRNLADAQEQVRRSEEALTQAHEEARQALEDLRLEAERAALGEEGARIRLIEARRELQRLRREGGTDLEFRQAVLSVKEAELDLEDAKNQNKRTTEALTEAERKGISGSDQVVAAREQLKQATESLTEAEQALADAQQQAASQATSYQQKVQQAFKDLSPAARSLARTIAGLRQEWIDLRKEVQEAFLPSVERSVNRLKGLLPIFRNGLVSTGRLLGSIFEGLAAQLTSPVWQRDLPTLFQIGQRVISSFGVALSKALDLFRNFVIAAAPVTDWLSDLITGWTEAASKAVEAGRATGRLQAFFQRAIDAATQVGHVLRDAFVALFNTFKEGAAVGQSFWTSLEEGAARWREWTESIAGRNALREWFEQARPAISEAVGLLKDIGKVLLDIAGDATGGLASLLRLVREKIVPAFADLGKSLNAAFAPQIVRAVGNVVEAFSLLGGQGGTFVTFLEILNRFVELLIWLVKNVPGVQQALKVFFLAQGAALALRLLTTVLKSFLFGVVASGAQRLLGFVMVFQEFAALASARGLPVAIKALGGGLGSLIGVLTGPVGVISAIAALAGGLAFLGDKLNEWAAARVWHQIEGEVVPAMRKAREEGEAVLTLDGKRTTATFSELTEAWVRFADAGAQSAMSNEEFAKTLNEEVIPAMYEGKVAGDVWNKVVDEAGDRGIDAAQALAEYTDQMDRQRLATEAVTRLQGRFGDALTAVAGQMGLTGTTFREEFIQAFQDGNESFQSFVEQMISAARDLREQLRSKFDGVSSVLSQFSGDAKVTAKEVIKAFDDQSEALKEYQENWNTVEQRLGEGHKAIKRELAQLGLEGAGLIKALADANEEEFARIIRGWKETQGLSSDLGDSISDELVPAIDDLITTLKKLPEAIAVEFGFDFSQAERQLDRFIGKAEDQGIVFTAQPKVGRKAHRGGLVSRFHAGGLVIDRAAIDGPPGPGEVDIRAQEGEVVFSRPAVRALGGAKEVARWQEQLRRRRSLRRFHSGGLVTSRPVAAIDDADPIRSKLELFRRLLEGAGLVAVVPKQNLSIAAPPVAVPSGEGTPSMAALHRWILSRFPVRGALFRAGPTRTINFQPGAPLSQHAFGNAVDYFGPAKVLAYHPDARARDLQPSGVVVQRAVHPPVHGYDPAHRPRARGCVAPMGRAVAGASGSPGEVPARRARPEVGDRASWGVRAQGSGGRAARVRWVAGVERSRAEARTRRVHPGVRAEPVHPGGGFPDARSREGLAHADAGWSGGEQDGRSAFQGGRDPAPGEVMRGAGVPVRDVRRVNGEARSEQPAVRVVPRAWVRPRGEAVGEDLHHPASVLGSGARLVVGTARPGSVRVVPRPTAVGGRDADEADRTPDGAGAGDEHHRVPRAGRFGVVLHGYVPCGCAVGASGARDPERVPVQGGGRAVHHRTRPTTGSARGWGARVRRFGWG